MRRKGMEKERERGEEQLLSNLAFVSGHTLVDAPSGGVGGSSGKKKKERKCGCSILLRHVYRAPSARFSHAKCNLLDQRIIQILCFEGGKKFPFEIPTCPPFPCRELSEQRYPFNFLLFFLTSSCSSRDKEFLRTFISHPAAASNLYHRHVSRRWNSLVQLEFLISPRKAGRTVNISVPKGPIRRSTVFHRYSLLVPFVLSFFHL